MKKATIAGVAMIAALFGIIYLFQQSAANAQNPPTTRIVTAAPQGEWVVLIDGYANGGNVKSVKLGDNRYGYSIVMIHTGTGKTRMVKWEADTPGNPNFQQFDTP